jgi:hypothetical protein
VAPVAEIAGLCAERGILCIVDVAQSAGILPLRVATLGADVVLGSCIKWLCGGPGAGFLWIRPGLIERLEPVDVGWFSHENPFDMDIHSFRYAQDARRFWGGTPSIAPFVVAAASLRHIHSLGVEAIHAHNRRLVQVFTDALPPAWRARLPAWPFGGTICMALGADFDAVTAALAATGAQFDSRADVIRLSFHACNGEDDALAYRHISGDASLEGRPCVTALKRLRSTSDIDPNQAERVCEVFDGWPQQRSWRQRRFHCWPNNRRRRPPRRVPRHPPTREFRSPILKCARRAAVAIRRTTRTG